MAETPISLTEKRCVVVTGGEKGIGFEICRKLASNEIKVILTARNEKNGTEAVEKLKSSGLLDVVFHQLDVKDPASIASLAKFVETNFKKLDILVNNAGEGGVIIDGKAFSTFKYGAGFMQVTDKNAHLLKECLKTNYYGTKGVTEALLPLLQLSNSARIVNVSANYSKLMLINNVKVKAELNDVESLTEEIMDDILQWFLRDFKEDKSESNGWPTTLSAYKLSKATINAYTRLIAKKFPKMLVNCVHPGYVQTDSTCNTGFLTPEEGARGPAMMALLPDGGPSGLFFDQMQESTF